MATKKNQNVMLRSTIDIEACRIQLSNCDPVLAVAHDSVQPFEWHIRESGFTGLVRMIIEQQVSVAAAEAIWKKFKAGVGKVTSKNLARFEVEELRTFALSRPKAKYVLGIAEAELSGLLDFKQLKNLNDEDAIGMLTALKGVGRWTAEVYLMFCEGRTDLFPAGDLALQEGYRLAARKRHRPTEKALYVLAEKWRPHRGVAANLLWSYYREVRSGQIQLPDFKFMKPIKKKAKSKR